MTCFTMSNLKINILKRWQRQYYTTSVLIFGEVIYFNAFKKFKPYKFKKPLLTYCPIPEVTAINHFQMSFQAFLFSYADAFPPILKSFW